MRTKELLTDLTSCALTAGFVDGTYSVVPEQCSGFLFLFNPSGRILKPQFKPSLAVNMALGFDPEVCGNQTIAVSKLFPVFGNQTTILQLLHFSDTIQLPEMDGRSCMVLQLAPVTDGRDAHMLLGLSGSVDSTTQGALKATGVVGEAGSQAVVKIAQPTGTMQDFPKSVFINDLEIAVDQRSELCVQFDGSYFPQSKRLDNAPDHFTGGVLNMTLMMPQAVADQLAARALQYPIQWQQSELQVSWLAPARLLLHVDTGFALNVNDTVTVGCMFGHQSGAN